jgi:hypothetical protein
VGKNPRGFLVCFTSKGILNRAMVNQTGYCETLIKYYTEKELPADVRHRLKAPTTIIQSHLFRK